MSILFIIGLENKLNNISENDWIGFCAYRRFWLNEKNNNKQNLNFQDKVLKIPELWEDYQVILGDKIIINDIKWIKILSMVKFHY